MKIITFSVVILLSASCFMFGGAWPQPKGTLFAKTYLGSLSAARYWDKDAQSVTQGREYYEVGSKLFKTYPNGRSYTLDFSAIVTGIYAEYGITDNLTAIVDLPYGFFSLKEQFERDPDTSSPTYSQKPIRNDLSINTFVWYGIGGRYLLRSGKTVTSIAAGVRIPPGFTPGIFADTVNKPFLSDGALQKWVAFEIGIPFSDGWFESELRYNSRSEELHDEFFFHAEYGNKSAEEVMLKFAADINIGLGNTTDFPQFDTRRTILNETYGALSVGVIVQATEKIFCDFTYQVRLFGSNTWGLNGAIGGIGIKTSL